MQHNLSFHIHVFNVWAGRYTVIYCQGGGGGGYYLDTSGIQPAYCFRSHTVFPRFRNATVWEDKGPLRDDIDPLW